jgi:crotonobetaine/carnitine-CoA ligase
VVDFLNRNTAVLRTLLERNALEAPDEPYMMFEDGSSWSKLACLRQAYGAANELRAAGVTQGSVVAVALPNGADFFRAWWGTCILGAAITPVNPAYRGSLISHMMGLAKPVAFVTAADFRPRLEEVGAHLTTTLLDPSELVSANHQAPVLERAIEAWDSISLAMTSGTTGPSKLVRISYAHCLSAGIATFDTWGRSAADIYLCDVPCFHVGGLYLIHSSLFDRNKVAVRSRPDLANYWEVARDTRATFSQIYSSMVTYLDAQPPRGAERSHNLRMALALPLPADPEAFKGKFGIEHLLIAWGSTEVAGPIVCQPGYVLPRGSTGQAMPGFHVKIVDENDIELPHGAVGEAIVRHDLPWLISTEYVGNPAATAQAWRNGWFHTGDLMRRDGLGNFFFVDRLKDCVRRRGQNISSYEVEIVVQSFPGIAEAAVVPERSSADLEDEVKAWIVTDSGVGMDYRALLEYCSERLPHYMVPRYFELIGELPKTPSAKVQKHLLRERGSGRGTWDRLAHGLDVTRHGITKLG